ncbi:MAG: type II secretion system protein N [Mariprofundaceae bacterium]|nr:type II secretion system protein N [Mariprofundaceae bacterium]
MVNVIPTIRGVEVVLVLIIAWVLAGVIMQSNTLSVAENTAKALVVSKHESSSLDLALIRNTPLFGKIEAIKNIKDTPIKARPIAAVAVVPPLALKLWGTVVAGEASVAILAVAGRSEQKVFHLHESIEDGVTLEVVWADAVEVLDHTQKRRIELRKPSEAIKPSPTPAIAPPSAGMVQRNISRKMINRQTRNFSALLSQARVLPHFSNGKADGFVINNIVATSLFQQIGLRNGDIIRKVNQTVIRSAGQAMELYQSLQKASNIQLEVERGGQIQMINYHIQ